MVINGYRLHSDSISDVSAIIHDLQKKINKASEKKYHRLLGEEMCFIADSIALNIIPRNPEISVFEDACRSLDFHIRNSEASGIASSYNFSVHVYISFFEGYSYIALSCTDNDVTEIFKNDSRLEDFSVSEDDIKSDEGNKNEKEKKGKNEKKKAGIIKFEIWQKVLAMYSHEEPFTVNLTPEFSPKKEKIVYPEVRERAHKMAVFNTENSILKMLYAGQEIPPYRLMKSMDDVADCLAESETQIRDDAMKLLHILPDFADSKNLESLFLTGNMIISDSSENRQNSQNRQNSESAKIINKIEADAAKA